MKKNVFIILSFLITMVALSIVTSCGEDNEIQNEESKVSPDEGTDETPEDTKIANGHDSIPVEHSIEYTVLSSQTYTSIGFYNYYLAKATKLISSMSDQTSSTSATSSVDLKTVLEKIISGFNSVKEKQISIMIGFYHAVQIKYTTTDVNQKPIEASAMLFWHDTGNIKKVIFANHASRLGDFEDPSNGFAMEVLFAATDALVVLPDYIGAGITSDMSEPYLVSQLSGDVAVDSYLAAIKYAKDNISGFSSDFNGYIAGYSQGGQVSLAALRSLQQRSAERQAMLNVKRVICGDGPYDLAATFNNYLEQSTMLLPVIMPMAINGIMTGYPELSKNIDYKSCFTDYALSTEVPQAIYNNEATLSQVMGFPMQIPASEVLSSDIMNKTGTNYSRLFALLSRQSLCTDWQPKYPVLFIHDKGDTVVPYINMEKAVAGLRNNYVEDPIILDEGMDHGGGMIYMISNIINGSLLN